MDARTLDTAYADAKTLLQQSGCTSAALDARLLICHVTGLSHEQFILAGSLELTPEQQESIRHIMAERAQGKPVAKIVGGKEFYGRHFMTTLDTLDPRPDTEILVDACLKILPEDAPARVLDLGTGTGCVLITLLSERKAASGVAVDASARALDVARRNAEKLGVAGRMTCLQCDWFAAVDGPFDLIVSNPPYIPHGDISGLDKDVRDYDPVSALDGGADGLDPYRLIIPQSRHYLGDSGWLAFEVGIGQAEDVARLMAENGFDTLSITPDLAGIARVVSGKWAGKQ